MFNLESNKEIILKQKLYENNLIQNRIICLSKFQYLQEHKYEMIALNGNIYINQNNKYIKIWTGDLNLNLDVEILKKIAKETNTILFVSSENANRINIDDKKFIWNTSENIPIANEESIKKYNESKIKTPEILTSKYDIKNKNNEYPVEDIKTICGQKVVRKIKVPFNKILRSKHRRTNNFLTEVILEEELNSLLFVPKNEYVDYSKCCITKNTFDRLVLIDKEISNKKGIRHITSNFNIISIEFANVEKKNMKSYSDDYIYILDNFKKR